MKLFIFAVAFSLFWGPLSWSWDKRGHEIVASVAARILEEQKNATYLRSHEFDLGYYANVPDIIFRNYPPPISKIEPPLHYIDWNKDLENVFGSPKNLPIEFAEYKRKMGGKFNMALGVVPYRIHGLIKRCRSLAKDLTIERQGPLLVCLGILSHYTGDLSMPLHVTDNHDGQMTGQKGVHVFFEKTIVDQLDPQLKVDVMDAALRTFEKSSLSKMDSEAAVRWVIGDSYNHIPELLKIDKENNRANLEVTKEKFRNLIVNRLVQGAILTATVWNEILAPVHNFNDDHFYFFDGKPAYINPELE